MALLVNESWVQLNDSSLWSSLITKKVRVRSRWVRGKELLTPVSCSDGIRRQLFKRVILHISTIHRPKTEAQIEQILAIPVWNNRIDAAHLFYLILCLNNVNLGYLILKKNERIDITGFCQCVELRTFRFAVSEVSASPRRSAKWRSLCEIRCGLVVLSTNW